MLKLYYTPISPNSRRVWITLLEKQVEFELVKLNIDGDQFQPEFLKLNPFHHIPVLEDDDFSVFESLAILDYLEAKYPNPPLLPKDAKSLARVRMVELVTVNELMPLLLPLATQAWGIVEPDPQKQEKAKQQINIALGFFEDVLGDSQLFGGEGINRADIVAGTVVTQLPGIGMPLDNYPKMSAWCEQLTQHPSWQKTQVSQQEMLGFISRLKARMQGHSNR